jgi:hypothetical protein
VSGPHFQGKLANGRNSRLLPKADHPKIQAR